MIQLVIAKAEFIPGLFFDEHNQEVGGNAADELVIPVENREAVAT